MRLQSLTNDELLQKVYLERNPLTTTDLETALAERFQQLLDDSNLRADAQEVLDDFSIEGLETKDIEYLRTALQFALDHESSGNLDNARALLDVLSEFDINTPAELRKQLERLSKFDDVMNDLAEPLATLQTLAPVE